MFWIVPVQTRFQVAEVPEPVEKVVANQADY